MGLCYSRVHTFDESLNQLIEDLTRFQAQDDRRSRIARFLLSHSISSHQISQDLEIYRYPTMIPPIYTKKLLVLDMNSYIMSDSTLR